MTTLRRTIERDVLDEIVWKHYGNVRRSVVMKARFWHKARLGVFLNFPP